MAFEDIQEIPRPPSNDPNWITDWRNWKKLKAEGVSPSFPGTATAKQIIARQGLLQRFSISEDLTIPTGWYTQMVAPVIETGVTLTVEAGGLWFVDG